LNNLSSNQMANSLALKIVGGPADQIRDNATLNAIKGQLQQAQAQSGDQLQQLQTIVANCPASPTKPTTPPSGNGAGNGNGQAGS
jgi:hypothetical protein